MNKNFVSELIKKNMLTNNDFVYDSDQVYSYQELLNYYKKISNLYRENHIKRVLICLPQSFEGYATVVASFLCGVIFCTISSKDPVNRKKIFLEEYKPDVVITKNGDEIIKLSDEQNILCFTSSYINNINLKDSQNSEYFVEQKIAYVIFTSGSTGFPKGVMLKRDALINIVIWLYNNFQIKKSDVCSQYSNMSFDMSLIDIFIAATAGASLVPFPEFKDKLFPISKIQKYGITFWHSVPNVIDIFKSQCSRNSDTLVSIRKCKFGGEQTYATQLQYLYDMIPNAVTYLTYGTSEITFICSCVKLDKSNYLNYSKRNMSLGFSIEGWNIMLDGEENNIGEIVIYGDNIGDGYINENDNFDQFRSIIVNGKLVNAFFTHDIGTYIDGALYYVGRSDFQVKVNGARINLSEIDRVMRMIPSLISSYTLFYEGKIYTVYTGEKHDIQLIRDYFSKELPNVYLPSKFIWTDEIPKNNSGKFDRKNIIKRFIKD